MEAYVDRERGATDDNRSLSESCLLFGYFTPGSPRADTVRRYAENRFGGTTVVRTEARNFVGKVLDLIAKFLRSARGADTVIVMFLGQYVTPLAYLLTRLPRRRLILDAFVSVYDSQVRDRGLVSPRSIRGRLYFSIDWLAMRMADEILVDTWANAQEFARLFGIPEKRFTVVYLEARRDLFRPLPASAAKTQENGTFSVLFYGSFIPLQGIEHILAAAAILQERRPAIRFQILGGGQTRPAMERLAATMHLRNLDFTPTIPFEHLPDKIRGADLVLGIFGTTPKSMRVIPHKVVEALACGKYVLTARTPAMLEHEQSPLLHFCEAGNSEDLAAKIEEIASTSSGA